MNDKLVNLADALVAVAKELKELANASDAATPTDVKTEPNVEPITAEAKSQPTLEEVRTVLAEISRSGKTAEMKALLSGFGAAKLSDVDPGQYEALLQKAKEVADA